MIRDAPPDQGLPHLSANDDQIDEALQKANLPTLLLCLAQLTGDATWLSGRFQPTRTAALGDNDLGGFDEKTQAEIRLHARRVICELRDREVQVPSPPDPEELVRMLGISLGETVPSEYGITFSEEAGFCARSGMTWTNGRPAAADSLNVIVIGAGPAGISVARMLQGLDIDFEILERGDDVGGVWRANVYPGAGVDTPAHMYSFSYAPRREWSRYYPKQPEIQAYLKNTAEDLGITERIRFGTEAKRLDFDESMHQWNVTIVGPDGHEKTVTARCVISCVGVLSQPKYPKIPGMERFTGTIVHSSNWEPGLDLTDKRVAIIGAGATAMQLAPAVAPVARQTIIFQRSPQWVAPNANYLREVPPGVRLLMEHLPYYASFYRLRLTWQFQDKLLSTLRRDPAWPHPDRSVNSTNDRHRDFFIRYLNTELDGRPDLIDKVVPDYPPYGKRILMDNNWFKTLRRDDVILVADDVASFEETSVTSGSAEAFEVDLVVLATGFHATRMLWPMVVNGRGGVPLHEQWGEENASAYLGVSVPNFPNLFLVGGPHTFLGHGGSALYSLEVGISHVAQLLMHLAEGGHSSVEVRPEVCEDYNRRIDEEHEQLIWTHPGMSTWFRNSAGRVVAMTPWRGVDYWTMAHSVNPSDFLVDQLVVTLDGQK